MCDSEITHDVATGVKYINSVAEQSANLLTNINELMQEQRDTVIEIKTLVTENLESEEELLTGLRSDIRGDIGRFYTRVLTVAIPVATVLAFLVAL